jgi:hyperosmotically inducible protein
MYNDAAIATRVREAILLDPRVSAQDITVTCEQRIVTLAGEVDTVEAAQSALDTATRVDGVKHVINALQVRPTRWPPPGPEILPWYERR